MGSDDTEGWIRFFATPTVIGTCRMPTGTVPRSIATAIGCPTTGMPMNGSCFSLRGLFFSGRQRRSVFFEGILEPAIENPTDLFKTVTDL